MSVVGLIALPAVVVLLVTVILGALNGRHCASYSAAAGTTRRSSSPSSTVHTSSVPTYVTVDSSLTSRIFDGIFCYTSFHRAYVSGQVWLLLAPSVVSQ